MKFSSTTCETNFAISRPWSIQMKAAKRDPSTPLLLDNLCLQIYTTPKQRETKTLRNLHFLNSIGYNY